MVQLVSAIMGLSLAKNWIVENESEGIALVSTLSGINSWSHHPEGIKKCRMALIQAFASLNSFQEDVGPLLAFSKRNKAPKQVLLGGHLDTVHSNDSPFQSVTETMDRLIGPGVTDMKGGLVALLMALQAYERFQENDNLGWKVLISSDEEIGSPESTPYWIETAKRFDFGLLYEPAYPDGSFVSERMGSYNILAEVSGKMAHAGRDFSLGKSANRALVEWVYKCFEEGKKHPTLQINAGEIKGGHAANVIPDHAFCKLNLRSYNSDELAHFASFLENIGHEISIQQDVQIKVSILNQKPPKLVDSATSALFDRLEKATRALGQPFKLIKSGGVCDGNILQAAGLPTIDTMGVIGGGIHTNQEYMVKKSLVEKALLTLEILWSYSK